jgi:hypothetical protein
MKYIIEVEDKPFELLSEDGFTSEKLFRVKGFNSLVFDWNGLNMLTPYTAPDLEQVRKEAYDKGYEDCRYKIDLGKVKNDAFDDGYKCGLADAWEAARKIHRMPDGDILDLFPDCYASVCTAAQVILKYDASEVIAKIKAWEDGKQEIKIGDEVGYYGVADEHGNVCYSGIVLEIRKGDYLVMEKDGKTYALKKKLVMSKTGRHFPEIATVLEKMKERQE